MKCGDQKECGMEKRTTTDKTYEAEINRLESINDTLVVQLKELRMSN